MEDEISIFKAIRSLKEFAEESLVAYIRAYFVYASSPAPLESGQGGLSLRLEFLSNEGHGRIGPLRLNQRSHRIRNRAAIAAPWAHQGACKVHTWRLSLLLGFNPCS